MQLIEGRFPPAATWSLLIALVAGMTACSAGKGDPGAAGKGMALRTTTVAAGADCASGGVRVETGVDDDGDAQLDDVEVDGTAFVCAGADGQSAQATLELPGAHCPEGGVMLTLGAGTPTYVCNGAPGGTGPAGQSVTATPEAAGVGCEFGGVKLEVGSAAPTYVCTGAAGQDGQSVAITPSPRGPPARSEARSSRSAPSRRPTSATVRPGSTVRASP